MNRSLGRLYRAYLLPGVMFQSVVIAGGYGTGRELAEFFMPWGGRGGLLAMALVTPLVWGLVCALSFEFARVYQTYDYKRFFERLLGKGWRLFEISYFMSLILVMAVIAAAAGEILHSLFGLNGLLGACFMMLCVGLLIFFGRETIERAFSWGSGAIYVVYFLFFVLCISRFGGKILTEAAAGAVVPGWYMGGIRYACYNLGTIPAIMISVRHCETRKEALTAGFLCGIIGTLPAIFLYLPMLASYPQVMSQALPVEAILRQLNVPILHFAFQVVLLSTLIATATGMIFAVSARFEGEYPPGKAPKWIGTCLSAGLLTAGALLARAGLIALISKGYGGLTWVFMAVYVLPICTVGVLKICKKSPSGR